MDIFWTTIYPANHGKVHLFKGGDNSRVLAVPGYRSEGEYSPFPVSFDTFEDALKARRLLNYYAPQLGEIDI